MDDFKAFEAGFSTPFTKIRAGIIECVAKFDQHVQGHEQAKNIFAPRVVDEGLDGNKRAARRQGVL